MELKELSTYQLICDLACELSGESSVGTYKRSEVSKTFITEDIINELVRSTSKSFGMKIIEWAEWYMGNNDQLTGLEKTNLLAVVVSGRILDIKNKQEE